MRGMKEICNKIINIQNTQKVTRAMEVVSASKMRKLKHRMAASRPYINSMKKVIWRLTTSNLEYRHPYLKERKVKRIGYLVISTDRGLCGSLNINLFKKLLIDMKSWSDKNIQSDLAIIGSKGVSFFEFTNSANIIAQVTDIGDNPPLLKFIDLVKVLLQAYDKSRLDKLFIVSNKFVNILSQIPIIIQLLPLSTSENEELKHKSWDYLYEPSNPKVLLDAILRRYIESKVYQNVIENLTSEQAARIISMKAATHNGENLIQELRLAYNKTRQANITQELTEIISGASAV